MGNIPIGCSDEFGAPWNDVEYEREVEVVLKSYITVSFKGPREYDSYEIDKAIEEQIKEDLSKIDYEIKEIEIKQ